MNGECSKTPYNSIYEALNTSNQKPDAELTCCKHGIQCQYGKKPLVLENQYVNLSSPSNEQQVAENLAAKLKALIVEPQPRDSKTKGSERRKKKIKSAGEETNNQAYVNLGPPTEETTKSSLLMNSDTTTSTSSMKMDDAYAAYIGVYSASDAEAQVTQRGDFLLYHQFDSASVVDNLSAGLPLMVVYFTTTKKHRHYPIRSSKCHNDFVFSVDCGYPNVRKHCSISQLVKYYKTFGPANTNPVDTYADEFSWWLE
uniref:SH2 domain-containing protein n=1 Tax=Caenorhabditis japonica TaxID=281687 RepID=A0A8R1I6U2_CAEJA